MDVSAEVCQAIANVLVVLFLGLIVDRRAITRRILPVFVVTYGIVLLFGVMMAVQGAGKGLDGFAGVLVFIAFVFGVAAAAGTLLSLVWTDREDR